MTTPGSATVHVSSSADGVGWIVLDNPSKLNAISLPMWRILSEALTRFAADPGVRCVVLRGQGEQAFCSGADISQFETVRAGPEANAEYERVTRGTLDQLRDFPRPTMALVSGYCIGGGLALAMACDLRIAAVGSRFGIPAAKLGIGYHHAGVKALTDLVGPAQAKQILFVGERFDAAHALRIGLVNEVLAAEALEPRVRALAATMAANAPLSIASAKYAVATASALGEAYNVAGCTARERACVASVDHAEGRRAFMAKRPPLFTGR